MAFSVTWEDEAKTILRLTFESPVLITDLAGSQDAMADQLDSVSHPVFQIVDMTAMTKLPEGTLTTLPQLGRHRHTSHPNGGPAFCVVDNVLVEQIAGVFAKVFRRFVIVRTVEEAHRLIAERSGSGQ